MVGLKARVVGELTPKRVETLPVPGIVRVADASFQVFGGKNPAGWFRLVDPITRSDRELTIEAKRTVCLRPIAACLKCA